MVTTITEQEHLGLETLVEEFSQHLPHRGGVSPIFAHQLPWVPVRERDQQRARMNGQAVNKRTLAGYYWMFKNLQRKVAEKVGYSERTISNYFATDRERE